jgi:hypothetical protein
MKDIQRIAQEGKRMNQSKWRQRAINIAIGTVVFVVTFALATIDGWVMR